jgi:predicted outer membrane repeat protein
MDCRLAGSCVVSGNFSLAPRAVYAGNAVVGNGSPASCTEAAFDAALATASNGGGTITFNCGPAVKTINFTVSKFLTLGNVTIDGDNRIVLKAGNAERHFFAGPVTFRLRNITLREGDSLVSGGAIEASGAQVIVDNVQFLSNRSSVTGGAIYCYDGSLIVRNSRFENNSAGTGGAIFNDGCTVELDTVTFRNNRATGSLGRGGAVENGPLGALTVRNSRFETNSALDGGGLFVAGGSTATLDSATFVGNSGGYGGGIENSGDLTLTNSLFQNNTVTGSGGGLWNIDGTAQVQRTTFSGNTAYEGGGSEQLRPVAGAARCQSDRQPRQRLPRRRPLSRRRHGCSSPTPPSAATAPTMRPAMAAACTRTPTTTWC